MEKEGEVYCKCLSRYCSLNEIKSWNEGESTELEKWLGFGFFNHLFVSNNGKVTLYYNEQEGDKFHEVLKEKLTEELFGSLCDKFFELIEKSKLADSDTEIFNLIIECWPALTIFDEISKYPELAEENMIRRLLKVRKATESFQYSISKRLENKDSIKDYILFRGELFFQPFADFIKEKNIIINN